MYTTVKILTKEDITAGLSQDTIYISMHALNRMRERNGWNKKTAIRIMSKIANKECEIPGWLRRYMRNKQQHNPDDKFVVHGEQIYVFTNDGNVLKTVYNQRKRGWDKKKYEEREFLEEIRSVVA